MILPILPYGNPILKTKALEINKSYPKLKDLIKNMWETMYSANGGGLAAPQIGLSIRIFVIDTFPFSEQEELSKKESMELSSFKKVFINPKIIEENGEDWDFNEGCLSIPEVRADIKRSKNISIKYFDNTISNSKKNIKEDSLFVCFNEAINFDIYENEIKFKSLVLFKNTGISLPKNTIVNTKFNKNTLLLEIENINIS